MKHIVIMLLIYKTVQTSLTSALFIHAKTFPLYRQQKTIVYFCFTPSPKHHEGNRGRGRVLNHSQ